MKFHYILPLLAFISANAEVSIDFENADGYKSLGVYDVWEESPLRTGQIAGNWSITPNPDNSVDEVLGEAANPSALVLGAQRSRFGSNRMGVRIDLNEPFKLTPTLQYVHVMLLKPIAGRVMLVGLGSREERLGQNPYCEQFWVVSSGAVEPGKWSDAVFPIKGIDGINIRSLVVVPDLESPHNLTEDFLFYVDDIELNSSSVPRVSYEYYPVTGGKPESAMTRTDRVTSSISLTSGGETQSFAIEQQINKKLYQNLVDKTFYVQLGNAITPELGYAQNWMHSYCYVDLNNDGKFSDDELLSYNAYAADGSSYKNSKGESVGSGLGNGQCGKMPAFTLPADTRPGRYRMRLKLDWNSLDPAGNPGDAEGKNLINDNGGMIADVMLNVCDNTVEVNDFQLNGEVLAEDGSKLSPYLAPYNAPFTIRMSPEKGFHHEGADVKVGFNLNGEAIDKYGNPQYSEFTITEGQFTDGLYTIPAEMMRGNLLINGNMVENGTDIGDEEQGLISVPENLIANDDANNEVYNTLGIKLIKPQHGLKIVNGKKILL
ncbi:MAG: GEVED domain-containing protein [Bacteroides sp.]|nr:GEVED domain-containing protein [Bacteroides sp.]MCM1378913.1 GEVED domain-containing protein [Bacteroides sp.]MCM1445529.1 GEVED domain-containing protein [Prevotella sp.]